MGRRKRVTNGEVTEIETGRVVFRAAASGRAVRRRRRHLAGARADRARCCCRPTSCASSAAKPTGGGGLLLTVEITREGFGFSRFEARTQNGVTLVQVYGRRDGEAAGSLALAGAADTNVLLTGEDGGTILYEASGER